MNTGNIIEVSIPIDILPLNISAAKPVRVGPMEHPTSPASARNANIAVPPPFSTLAAMLKVPGQKMPTDNPQKAHPISPNTGLGDSAVSR